MGRAFAAFALLAVIAAVIVFTTSIKAGGPLPGEDGVPDQKGMTVEELDALVETAISPGLDGKFYNEFPVAFHEIGWNFLIDARTAAAQSAWLCGGLIPAGRCSITSPPVVSCVNPQTGLANDVIITADKIANRYVFNSATPVLVERPVSGERFLVFYVQQNNWTGKKKQDERWVCPWANGTGPGSWIQNGGDEFVAFSAPATLAGARGDQLTLENDVLRPDDGWSWQFKAAVWEPDRGPDGRMTLFAKRTGPGGSTAKINHLMFNRTDDPLSVDTNAWESMFWNCQEPCTDPNTCSPQELAECNVAHGYRLTEISVVAEAASSDWDYVGVLSWFRFEVDRDVAKATSIRIKSRQHVELKDAGGNWVRIPWGGEVDFALQPTVAGRIHGIFPVLDQDGRVRYELWRIRAEQDDIRGGISPCNAVAGGDDSQYLNNLAFYGTVRGMYADFYYFDPDPQEVKNLGGGPFTFDSTGPRDWHLPGDYNATYTWVLGRLQLPDAGGTLHDFFYMGTRDPLICTVPTLSNGSDGWDRGTGKGVAVSEMVRTCNGIFCDGFESGHLNAWSAVEPAPPLP